MKKKIKKSWQFISIFLLCNLFAIWIISSKESSYINESMTTHVSHSNSKLEDVMDNYSHSFQLFAYMMTNEIKNHPDPDDFWNYLKSIDHPMLEIEGDTFDGLYMYYKGRYLYSWDTPYSQYESTGYIATQRPWYKAAKAGNGEIVFTPPYMSYANHYILSTISQLQPDGETVFAYDIKMGDIQELVSNLQDFPKEQMMIFDKNGTIIGSSNELYLGGNLYQNLDENKEVLTQAQNALADGQGLNGTEIEKLQEQVDSAQAFYDFQNSFGTSFQTLLNHNKTSQIVKLDGKRYYGYIMQGNEYSFMVLVPFMSMLQDSMQVWLIPLLIVEILLIYILSHISKEMKNRELHAAYIELGQTQRRLEIALNAAQKAAAIDELTGMMNLKSFRKAIAEQLNTMDENEAGILIMIDGDNFKSINDNYGHMIGDEVIKLSAQMIVGRIRTVDLASRLHGDEFAIYVNNTDDYDVAKKIMIDINTSMEKEAKKRNMPSITLSAGAVIAKRNDDYLKLAKIADDALYEAKKTHNGSFHAAVE